MYQVSKLADYSAAALDGAFDELRRALNREQVAFFIEAIRRRKANEPATDAKAFRDRWLARKSGLLTQLNDTWLKSAPAEMKREVGRRLNEARPAIERVVADVEEAAGLFAHLSDEALSEVREHLEIEELRRLASQPDIRAEGIDVTLPGIRRPMGAEHPVIRTMNEIVGVFKAMGYSVAEGPEIETDWHNFEALNFPPNHPARDTQDTVFIAGQQAKAQRDRLLLRTHTSPVQIRAMQAAPPPLRVVAPGKVHRSDTPDATHSPIFHQVEGLAVDTNITFCDLKGTLDHAMKALFGSKVKTRFFPSFFPFTEPSADVAITCFKCGGPGCRVCKMSGWIELLGAGMVDPNVFALMKDKGYDPARVTGFAFGIGVERIAMAKYGIDDIQLFYSGDVRFLEQFA